MENLPRVSLPSGDAERLKANLERQQVVLEKLCTTDFQLTAADARLKELEEETERIRAHRNGLVQQRQEEEAELKELTEQQLAITRAKVARQMGVEATPSTDTRQKNLLPALEQPLERSTDDDLQADDIQVFIEQEEEDDESLDDFAAERQSLQEVESVEAPATQAPQSSENNPRGIVSAALNIAESQKVDDPDDLAKILRELFGEGAVQAASGVELEPPHGIAASSEVAHGDIQPSGSATALVQEHGNSAHLLNTLQGLFGQGAEPHTSGIQLAPSTSATAHCAIAAGVPHPKKRTSGAIRCSAGKSRRSNPTGMVGRNPALANITLAQLREYGSNVYRYWNSATRSFKCPACDKPGIKHTAREAFRHLAEHLCETEYLPFQCLASNCDYASIRAYNVERHVEHVHKIKWSEEVKAKCTSEENLKLIFGIFIKAE